MRQQLQSDGNSIFQRFLIRGFIISLKMMIKIIQIIDIDNVPIFVVPSLTTISNIVFGISKAPLNLCAFFIPNKSFN